MVDGHAEVGVGVMQCKLAFASAVHAPRSIVTVSGMHDTCGINITTGSAMYHLGLRVGVGSGLYT